MSKTKEVTIEQYREKLSSVCERASESTQKWLERHPGASRQEILDATYKITQAYGLAASTLAANKYDQDVALAEKQGFLKPGQIKEAEVWDPLGYGSIARAINGTLKNDSKEKLPDTIERMVKRFAEDTTLMNARRDGAEYAWIPAGDTCVFCLSLASNGWQRASRSTAEGNHADHIHPHCDCTFSVRFSKDTNVKGYHPEKIKAMIDAQEGDTLNDKLNSLRRQTYAEKKGLSAAAGTLPSKMKAYVPDYETRMKIIQDGINEERPIFVNKEDDLYKFAINLPEEEGFYTVVMHGNSYGVLYKDKWIDVDTLCAIIAQRKDYKKGTDIRLISCYTGSEKDGVASYMSKKLKVTVKAPDKLGIINRNIYGEYSVYSGSEKGKHDGEMVPFVYDKQRKET